MHSFINKIFKINSIEKKKKILFRYVHKKNYIKESIDPYDTIKKLYILDIGRRKKGGGCLLLPLLFYFLHHFSSLLLFGDREVGFRVTTPYINKTLKDLTESSLMNIA